MKNDELKKAEEIYDLAVDYWMHTDSGDEVADAVATAAASWASDNLLKARAKAKSKESENE